MKLKTLFLFAILLNLISCGTPNKVTVKSFSPTGEVEKYTNFSIEFDKALAPDTLIDKWTNENYISFEPGIKGKFKWLAPNKLIFSPEEPLKPMQKYKAVITNKVLFDKNYNPDFKTFEFHTQDFAVTKAEFFWNHIPHKNFKMNIYANLFFNYKVDPAGVGNFIKVFLNGEELKNFTFNNQKPTNILAMNLGTIQQTEKKQDIKLVVQKGLKSIIGGKPLPKDVSFKDQIPPLSRLEITDVTSGSSNEERWIQITTTQEVDKEQFNDYFEIEPKCEKKFIVMDNKIKITSDFNNEPTVKIKVKKGLPGLYGGKLEDDYEETVTLVNLSPSVRFSDRSGMYLLKNGEMNISANVLNIDKLNLNIYKVYLNNLIHFFNRNSYIYQYDYVDDYYNYDYIQENGKLIYSKSFETNIKRNYKKEFTINLKNLPEEKFKGIYLVLLQDAEHRWRRDYKLVSSSDLGIIAKESRSNLMVFVNSLSTARPVKNAKVTIISQNNQKVISQNTDAEGIVIFNNYPKLIEGFYGRLVLVEYNDDFNFLDFNKSQTETSRFDVSGRNSSVQYKTFIYSARNLYRPGEKVNISAVIRDNQTNVVKKLPLKLKIIKPQGGILQTFTPKLNEQGSFDINFRLPDYAQTGNYKAVLKLATGMHLSTYNFFVEEFVPDKMRVSVTNEKSVYKPGEKVKTVIKSEYFFGAKAADLKVEEEVQLKEQSYFSTRFPEFTFSNYSLKGKSISKSILKTTTDKNGIAKIEYAIPDSIISGGIYKGVQFISVFDPTGRTVNKISSFNVYPNDYYIGIKNSGYYMSTNSNIHYQFVAVDANDKPIKNFDAEITLAKYKWNTVLKKNRDGKFYYDSEWKAQKVWTKNVIFDKIPYDYSFIIKNTGEYEIRVSKAGEKGYVKHRFYAYGWGSRSYSSFGVSRDGKIDMVFDKKSYEPGDDCKILFKTPFAGRMLVTLERDSIYFYKFINVDKGSAELIIPIEEAYLPNFYVTATLFRPYSVESMAPFVVGHGFKSVKVEKKNYKLPVQILSPGKIKPNRTQTVTIRTKPEENIYITLAAIDEGILQLKNYKTPDLYKFMYAKQALSVRSFDIYKFLLPEILAIQSSPAGDAVEKQIQKRANPIKSKRFNLVSLWSGIRKTDSKGEVKINLKIPQYNGELRLMAIAYKNKSFGNAERPLKVADDLVIEPQIPRVLTITDKLTMPVTVLNNTDKKGKVEVTVSVKDPLVLLSKNKQEVIIEPHGSAVANFDILTKNKIGESKIIISTSGIADTKMETNIAIRPNAPLITLNGSGVLHDNEEKVIRLPKNFVEGTTSTKLILGNFPTIKYSKQLKELVRYPHGCVEQTTSKLFPQLYFDDLVKLAAPQLYKKKNPAYYIKAGIKKLESMQMYNGAIAYWPGGNYTYPWGSTYAAHFLFEAKKKGFKVNKNVLSNLISYLSNLAKQKSERDYYYTVNGKRVIKKQAKKATIYALYVLALAGHSDNATMNYYRANLHLVPEDMIYMLAAAYALSKKWTTAYELIPKQYRIIQAQRETGGSFDSEIRANAIALNMLLEIDPGNSQIPYIIEYLSNRAFNSYTTQDRAFLFLALGKAAQKMNQKNLSVDIYDKGNLIGKYKGKNLVISGKDISGDNLKLISSGKGGVYYYWEREGIPTDVKIKNTDSGLKVRRKYYDYETNKEITNGEFKQGQLVLCKISLTGFDRSAENIVITDIIPAGSEIENPRLTGASRITLNRKDRMNIQYTDIRDDRLILFTDLKARTTKEYWYLLRMVNKGHFIVPPITADAMYAKEFHSVNGGFSIFIR